MKSFKKTVFELLIFSLPIVAGQVGQMLFGVVDIAVGGRYSSDVVSALGVGNSLSSPFLVFGLGIAFQIGPMTAQRIKTKTLTNDFFYSSLTINIVLGILLMGLFILLPTFGLNMFGFPPSIIPLTKVYCFLIAPSILFSMIFQNEKEYLQAFEKTFFPNACILFFNVINLILNIALMFGKWGAPELGIVGTGISTFICRGLMMITLHIYICRYFNFQFFKIATKDIKKIISEGLPVAFGITSEVFMFSVTTIIAATMGIIPSAAHNVCLNIAATTFMVPLALSSSVSVKVGHSYGLQDMVQLKKYAWAAILLIFVFTVITCSGYLFIPESILMVVTNKKEIITFAAGLMFYVALFQIPDGLQASLQGVLRGISITKQTMWITIVSGLLSAPLSYSFAYYFDWGAKGLWLALGVVLTIQSISYATLLKRKLRVLENSWLLASDQSSPT